MFEYKGFIKVDEDGSFYPVSRIKELRPYRYDSLRTQIIFDDDKFIVYQGTMSKAIEFINTLKQAHNKEEMI